jgi:putative transposase
LRKLIEPNHSLSLKRQCELVGLPRSSWYYQAVPEDPEDLRLMRMLDEQYTKTPFYGVAKMTGWFREVKKEMVNEKRVRRLMRIMGLEAIYPKRNLSKPFWKHKKYPYLLRGLKIIRPNQVWGIDITYIRLIKGFVYLVAIIDWFSRYVMSWSISVTLDVSFCLEALEEALLKGKPDIMNSDQGVQFTCDDFTNRLTGAGIQISMDGRGRALDNVFTERLWRSVKYEDVYLKDYDVPSTASKELGSYFNFYNHERIHQSLDYKTPAMVHYSKAVPALLSGYASA